MIVTYQFILKEPLPQTTPMSKSVKKTPGEKTVAELREIKRFDFWRRSAEYCSDYISIKNNPNDTLNRFFKALKTKMDYEGTVDSLRKAFDR